MLQTMYVEATVETAAEEIPPAQLAKRQRLATQLCLLAGNPTSWTLADKQARRWLGPQCGCAELGIAQPIQRL